MQIKLAFTFDEQMSNIVFNPRMHIQRQDTPTEVCVRICTFIAIRNRYTIINGMRGSWVLLKNVIKSENSMKNYSTAGDAANIQQ